MNDRKLKQALKTVYQPPRPRGREEFLDRVGTSGMSMAQFLRSQVDYIRPWGWILSLAVFAAALYILWQSWGWQQNNDVWMVSALLPFVALSTVVELNRSARYGMEELEMAARFSLRAVMLARMGILGLGNLILLAALSPMVILWGQLTLAETGFYLLCPYCLTTFLGLVIVRRWRGPEGLYICIAVAVGISVLCRAPGYLISFSRTPVTLPGYVGITLFLFALMLWEYRKYLFDMEEYAWN